jgi:hypothetical protein
MGIPGSPVLRLRWAAIGDSYGNAMAESVIGLFKAEVIYARGAAWSLLAGLRCGKPADAPCCATVIPVAADDEAVRLRRNLDDEDHFVAGLRKSLI